MILLLYCINTQSNISIYYYMTHPTVQVQINSQETGIPLTERQRLKDDHLSTSLRFFSLPLGIGLNDRGPPF